MYIDDNIAKAIASIAVMAGGAYCMKITKGETGIGWALVGIFFIWA